MNHVHLGVLSAFVIFAKVVIIGFFWRMVAALNALNPLGQAMAFIY
jgi:hypothetical protein